ncbi:MAG TPA: hypothetical protein VGQ83_34125, partial [Polyangia bacterium]
MPLLLLPALGAAAEPSGVVLLLTDAEPALDDHHLVEEVAIYTRDLNYEVRQQPGAPRDVTSVTLSAITDLARTAGVRLVFWYRVHSDATAARVTLYAVSNNRGRITTHALRAGNLGSEGLDHVLALKVRAILTGSASLEPQEAVLPAPVAPHPPASIGAAPMIATRPAPPARLSPARAWVRAGYRVVLPTDVDLVRHALFLEGAGRVGSSYELHLGV